jgi:hypothetical protein
MYYTEQGYRVIGLGHKQLGNMSYVKIQRAHRYCICIFCVCVQACMVCMYVYTHNVYIACCKVVFVSLGYVQGRIAESNRKANAVILDTGIEFSQVLLG